MWDNFKVLLAYLLGGILVLIAAGFMVLLFLPIIIEMKRSKAPTTLYRKDT